ncbi:hypothetical protein YASMINEVIRUS_589 [Yasminevirus sp. GU-2018]|uniref:Protein-tyrosine phosphatase n=1 Tax=Yasminevirus sp. GU-2018 TaxID=2420051 RepID=A0A5K0UAK5_9VIRU|nr:hypothetical protein YASMINEVIRUS_589 [Yasminevirus sp. GU-2018]
MASNRTGNKLVNGSMKKKFNMTITFKKPSYNILFSDLIGSKDDGFSPSGSAKIVTPDVRHLKHSTESLHGIEFENFLENRYPLEYKTYTASKRYSEKVVVKGSEVILRDSVVVEASRISETVYACSAPTHDHISTFWKMVLERDIAVILSLTSWDENGKKKADPYMSHTTAETLKFGSIEVTNTYDATNRLELLCGLELLTRHIRVSFLKVADTADTPDCEKTKNVVQQKMVYHIHCTGWSDMSGIDCDTIFTILKLYSFLRSPSADVYLDQPKPDSIADTSELLTDKEQKPRTCIVKACRALSSDASIDITVSGCGFSRSSRGACIKRRHHTIDSLNSEVKTALVHCSAGLGRTGTFLALCTTVSKINDHVMRGELKSGSLNFVKIIESLRMKRSGLVQTNDQMKTLVDCAREYLIRLSTQGESAMINIHV